MRVLFLITVDCDLRCDGVDPVSCNIRDLRSFKGPLRGISGEGGGRQEGPSRLPLGPPGSDALPPRRGELHGLGFEGGALRPGSGHAYVP